MAMRCFLKAGDSAEIRVGHLELSKAMPESLAPRATGAREGSAQSESLTFSGDTLDEAVARVNQYSDRQLRVVDPRIAKLRLGWCF
jgi:ferric-dicitrate binding protein FerR (iron transport regulator)